MQSEQEKSAESSAGSSAESRERQEEPRTSRDAGPYLARRVFASGWRLVVQRQLGQHAVLPLPYFQIHSNAEGSVAATALPSTWPALRQKTYW